MMAEMEARFQDMFSGARPMLPEGGMADRIMPALKGEFRVDVSDHDDDVVVVADLPGLQKEDVQLRLHDSRTLEIATRQSTEEKDEQENYFMRERFYGSMRRVVSMPVDVTEEGALATFKNGVLEVRLKKTEPTAVRPIQIE